MYVESDFLFALAKPEDWLKENAEAALDAEAVYTSLAAYTEFLVYWYDEDTGTYAIDAASIVPNLLELVPVRPEEHEEALLAAAAFIDEYGTTPFDAIHAGIAHVNGDIALSTETDYDTVGVERVPLDSYLDGPE
ncbi:PIN domain-containing protein [Halobellus marinus]|uniref:PIN domain-containing protein n=1 Tax=Halobellus TaxID=1073986 RepID=UPI0028AFBDDC|nr:PIN domain-containing protein [Halobellus sp. DFY28]